MEFTLPSDTWIGLGLNCTDSSHCDMLVGNAAGGKPFILDTWEELGNRNSEEDTKLGGRDDVMLLSSSYKD